MLHVCPDALRADVRRFYGLDLDHPDVTAIALADLAANLPPEAMSWRRMDERLRWGDTQYLLARIADDLDFIAWTRSAASRKRGAKWRSTIPYPGRKTEKGQEAKPGMRTGHSISEIERLLALPRTPITES